MSRIRQARELRDEGFTLIELLIVIVVLGILAGIVVFGVGTFRSDSKLAACKADLKTVSVAEDAYNAKNDSFTDVTGLVAAGLLKSPPLASEGVAASTTDGAVTS